MFIFIGSILYEAAFRDILALAYKISFFYTYTVTHVHRANEYFLQVLP